MACFFNSIYFVLLVIKMAFLRYMGMECLFPHLSI